jgi:chromosome segregation ATPase
MTMLAKETETRALTLADYEARIHLYKEQIGVGYIGIGRTLLEAKEAKVVPHGQWEAWVTQTTGLTARQAQRCMQAATEIKDGSAMARLEMSKALMLLGSGLDEEAKEQIAQRAVDEGATVKELRERIKQQQQELKTAQRIAADETGRVTKAKLEALDAKEAADSLRCSLEAKQKENESLRGQLEGVKEYVADQKAQAADRARQEATAAARQQIEDLRADLEAAEAREEKRAAELEQLRHEHQQRAMEDARGLSTSSLTGFDLAAAVRAFIGSAGVLPQMGSMLRACSAQERETIRQNIETVAAWVESARAALGVYEMPDGAYVVE